ncbi:MAG: hypothetical protein WBS18_00530 [Candidatus Acidiferrales bacterium]
MSGIAGIFERGGAAAEREAVCAMTHFLAFRGPDACEVFSAGPVALGHAMLRTTR